MLQLLEYFLLKTNIQILYDVEHMKSITKGHTFNNGIGIVKILSERKIMNFMNV